MWVRCKPVSIAASRLRCDATHTTCHCRGAGLLALSLAAVHPIPAKAGQQCDAEMVQAAAAAQVEISAPDKSQGMSHPPAGLTALPAGIADSGTPDAGTSAQSACTHAAEDSSSSQECTSPAQRARLRCPQQAASLADKAETGGLLTRHCHQQAAPPGIRGAAAEAQDGAAGHRSEEATGLKVRCTLLSPAVTASNVSEAASWCAVPLQLCTRCRVCFCPDKANG